MNKSVLGVTLIEIIISLLILSLVMTGLVNLFISGKRWLMHSRLRMTAGELGKYFLDNLQMDVRQDQWGSNCLSAGIGCLGAQTIDNIAYTPIYDRTLNSPITNLNKVKLTITWNEPAP